jgi:hypothetical protein
MTYGGPLPALTASYSGLVNGDTSASLTTQPNLATTATAASHVVAGGYPITAGGAVDSNYIFTYVTGTLTITPAPLAISADNKTKVYGAAVPPLTASYGGFVNGDTSSSLTTLPTLRTTATAASHVVSGGYPILASGAIDPDYTIAYVTGTLTITPAPLTITADNKTMVFSAPLPPFTAGYSGFVNGDTPSSLTTPVVLSTTATSASPVGTYAITAGGATDSDYAITFVAGALTINQDATATNAGASANPSSFGQALTLTATVVANAPGSGTPTGNVDFFDATTGTDLGQASLSGGSASLTTAALPLGSNTITFSYSGDTNFISSNTTSKVSILSSILVLDATAAGALSLTGNASITEPGAVVVDSSAGNALQASGNAAVTALSIDVVGDFSRSGNAAFNPAPVTGAPALPDPLAGLAAPAGGTAQGSVNLNHGSLAINPGIYSSIKVSANGSLTLNPGIYILAGGGLAVTGNGSINGAGVMLYNTGSNFPNAGGNFGDITLSGGGSVTLSAAATGSYAGVVIFQSHANTRALSLSGNGVLGLTGVIYAPSAQVLVSGNAQLNAALVVDHLTLSGNGVSTQVADGASGSALDTAGAGTLLAGDLFVYVSDPAGYFTGSELDRIRVGQSTGSSFINSLWDKWSTSVTWVDVQVGDFNGDGKNDITGRVLQSGQWWTGVSTGSSFQTNFWDSWAPTVPWVDVHEGIWA